MAESTQELNGGLSHISLKINNEELVKEISDLRNNLNRRFEAMKKEQDDIKKEVASMKNKYDSKMADLKEDIAELRRKFVPLDQFMSRITASKSCAIHHIPMSVSEINVPQECTIDNSE